MPRKSLPTRQTHAALPTLQSNTSPATYKAVTATYRPYSPYKTSNLDDYASFINALPLCDLQNHAISLGSVIPADNRDRLIERLLEEFTRYNGKLERAAIRNGNMSNVITSRFTNTV